MGLGGTRSTRRKLDNAVKCAKLDNLMIPQSHIEPIRKAPIPIKGHGIAAPHTEHLTYIVLWAALVIAAVIWLGYAIHQFDLKEQAKERARQEQIQFDAEARELRKHAIDELENATPLNP